MIREGTDLHNACHLLQIILSDLEYRSQGCIFEKQDIVAGYKFLNQVGWWLDGKDHWPRGFSVPELNVLSDGYYKKENT